MSVFRTIVFVAALAGFVSGIFVTAAHHFGTAAIIAKAEVYEKAAEAMTTGTPAMSASDMADMPQSGGEAMWEPKDGLERTAFTLLADVLTGIGFALLLASAFVISRREVDWRRGLYWGLAGFATFTLAPGLGLPPEVPGTAAAPLLDRQIWWMATALATGAGLALLFLTQRAALALAGVGLLVLPHVFGAPQPAAYKSAAPESLAHEFVVAAVITSLLFWILLGSLSGFLYKRFQATA
jgi:cobalt transporter subunit CbtA